MNEFAILVVPPGGGETDYQIMVKGNGVQVPRPGEYIVVNERPVSPTEGVVAAFKVRYATTHVDVEGQEDGSTKLVGVNVEAEPVFHHAQSESHRKLCERYHVSEHYPESGY